MLIFLACVVFWIWMIVDCAKNEVPGAKAGWLIFMILLGFIGAPLYFLVRKLPRKA